jgi:SAM-dependent methyltransferase
MSAPKQTRPTTARPTTVRLQRMVRAYRESAALMAGVELGLFTKVAEGGHTEASLSDALGITRLHGERIIVACVGLGLLERDGDKLLNAPDVERFLVEGQSAYAGEWMLFTKPDWDKWGHLTEHLRNETPPRADNVKVSEFTVDDARKYHQATYSIGRGAGRLFVRQVDLTGKKHLIDIGGGSGAYCIEACKVHPDLRASVLDLASVAEVAKEFIAEQGMTGRIEALACDFNNDPFPQGADVAVMASNLPMYGREEFRAVVKKAYDALAPGGEMHLVGEALNAERTAPADAGLWGLSEAIVNGTGLSHSVADVEGYFRAAGFGDIVTEPFVEGVLTRTSGRKAG